MTKLNQFDSIARYYDWLAYAVYGRAIRKAQVKYLPHIPDATNILVLGGGTGWWLKNLLAENTTCTIWYIEASKKMIQYAVKNSNNSSRIKFIHGTHKDIPHDIRFDVIITFFFFDLFDDKTLRAVVDDIKNMAHEKSIWLVSDFVSRKRWHSFMLWIMYSFFRNIGAIEAKNLPNWRRIMRHNDIRPIFSASYFGGFIQSNLYEM